MMVCRRTGITTKAWTVGRYLNRAWARPLSLADAIALVERVRSSAARSAREGLEALATRSRKSRVTD
jgi:hypothetical protein